LQDARGVARTWIVMDLRGSSIEGEADVNINRTPLAFGLATTLLLGACSPASIYTEAEAPRNVTLDTTTTRVDLRFAPGSAQLSPAEIAQLRQLAASGSIAADDRG